MTKNDIDNLKVGDQLIRFGERGIVTMINDATFSVSWNGGPPQIVQKSLKGFTGRIMLEHKPEAYA